MSIPFVEKYRPTRLNDIVLSDVNKLIINNIIKTKIYPNLMLYGPPGTGKTTTIINLIKHIQNDSNKSLLLHLNASDERGIDTIRNQITKFINSKPIFSTGIKFIVLDEVDYMTKNAQQALKYLLQQYSGRAVFCLMCNYISKIDDTLKNEFIELKFNQLPHENIISFLENIVAEENLNISKTQLLQLQQTYKNDIRSMINFIQLHNDNAGIETTIVTDSDILNLHTKIIKKTFQEIRQDITMYCINHNITPKLLFIRMFSLLMKDNNISIIMLNKFEMAIHNDQYNIYELEMFIELFKENSN